MVDQVSSLQDRHVAAGILSGNQGVDKKFLASMKDTSEGCYRLLYSAPEAILGSEQWKDLYFSLLCLDLWWRWQWMRLIVCTNGKYA